VQTPEFARRRRQSQRDRLAGNEHTQRKEWKMSTAPSKKKSNGFMAEEREAIRVGRVFAAPRAR
jgi:hypothetical protein